MKTSDWRQLAVGPDGITYWIDGAGNQVRKAVTCGTPGLPRHPLTERFHAILAEIGALHDKKGRDYGRAADPFANVRASEEWGVTPWVGAMVRLTDKVRRLQVAAQGGTLANEGVLDSLNDIAVYAIIARVLYEDTLVPSKATIGPCGFCDEQQAAHNLGCPTTVNADTGYVPAA